ncbi:MAG: twin-arginine translocase TatA/TatE family subunit [Actinomycetes bacterium]|jgi:Tat protein translocase TatB subunit
MLQVEEIIWILLIALIVLGPTRLPEAARKLGAWASELRSAAREITQGLEAEVAEVKKTAAEIKQIRDEIKSDLDAAARYEWTGPKPVSGPTPEDAMADLEKLEAGEELTEDGE